MDQPTTRSCPLCHAEIDATARKCRFCGEWVQEAEGGPETATEPTEATSTGTVAKGVSAGIFGCVAAPFVLVVVLFIVLFIICSMMQ